MEISTFMYIWLVMLVFISLAITCHLTVLESKMASFNGQTGHVACIYCNFELFKAINSA